jgi:alcohol dehydrogenase class IV
MTSIPETNISLRAAHGKTTIRQLPIPSSENHNAIINAEYLIDIVEALETWTCQRVVLVHSKALGASTDVIKKLEDRLEDKLVATKGGVGAHSPYPDVIEIAKMLHEHDADCLISVGGSSYSDACKIARLLHATLPPSASIQDVEDLVDQDKGIARSPELNDPKVRLILVPTSLSASEWNNVSSATNPHTHKKQHFETENAASDLILLDPDVAATSPRKLWLSSGVRAVDHCVETMCNPQCTEEASGHMQEALATLLKGLKEYKEGEQENNKEELLKGISECQLGSRQAMMGLLMWKIPLGPSHAIGHQLGSVKNVMHGVTSCVMLAPVLRYTLSKSSQQKQLQDQVLRVFNETLIWREESAGDAVEKFVKMLELPSSLDEVGVTEMEDLAKVAERTMTDVWGGGERQIKTKEEVLRVLDLARK